MRSDAVATDEARKASRSRASGLPSPGAEVLHLAQVAGADARPRALRLSAPQPEQPGQTKKCRPDDEFPTENFYPNDTQSSMALVFESRSVSTIFS